LSVSLEVSESELRTLQESAKRVLDEYVKAGKIRYVSGSVPVLVYGASPEVPSFRKPRIKNLEMALKQYGDFFNRGEGIMFTPFGAYVGKPDLLIEAAKKAGLTARVGYNRFDIIYGENPTQVAFASQGFLKVIYKTTLSKEDIMNIRKDLELARDTVKSTNTRRLLVRALALLNPLVHAPYYEGVGFDATYVDPETLERNKKEFVKTLEDVMKQIDDPKLTEMLMNAIKKVQDLRIVGVTYRAVAL